MPIYLLIKEHNVTGLKYLCKHEAKSFKDCIRYCGSGTYWKRHIKKHGKDLKTTCLFVSENKNDFSKYALLKSLEFDIVKSKEWANLTEERGQGGRIYPPEYYRKASTDMWKNNEFREAHLQALIERIKKIQPLAAKAASEKLKGVKKTEEHKNNMKGKRPHVNQSGSQNNNAKSINTPFGIFGSIKEASMEIEGYTYKMIWDRLNSKNSNWSYINV